MKKESIIDYCSRPAFAAFPEAAYMSCNVINACIRLLANAINALYEACGIKYPDTLLRSEKLANNHHNLKT
jgi:hypothetical protein